MMRKQKSPIRAKVLSSLTRAFSGKKQQQPHPEDLKDTKSNINIKQIKQFTKNNNNSNTEYEHSFNRSVDQVLGFNQVPARSYRLNRSKQTEQKKIQPKKVVQQKTNQQQSQESSEKIISSRSFVKDKRLTVGDSRAIHDQKSQISQSSRAKTSKAEENLSLFNLTQSQKEISNQLAQLKQQNKELTLMKLSQEARQTLKKIQIYDRLDYGAQSINICGNILTSQVKRLQKIKNGQNIMRNNYYDNQLTITALNCHVKFMTQMIKKQKQLIEINRSLKQKQQTLQRQKSQQSLIKKSYKKQQPLQKTQQISISLVEQLKKKIAKLQQQAKKNQILLSQKEVELQRSIKKGNDKDQQLQTLKHSLARLKQESLKKEKQLKQLSKIKKQLLTAQNQAKSLQVQILSLRQFKVQTQKRQQVVLQSEAQKQSKIKQLYKEILSLKQFQTTCMTFLDSFTQKISFNFNQKSNVPSTLQLQSDSNPNKKSLTQLRPKNSSLQKKQQVIASNSTAVNRSQQIQSKLRIVFPQQKLLRQLLQPFLKAPLSKNQNYKCITKMLNSFIFFLQTSKSTQKQISIKSQASIYSLQKQLKQTKMQLQKQQSLSKKEQDKLLSDTNKQAQKKLSQAKRQAEQSSAQLKRQFEKVQKLYQKTSSENIKLKQNFAQTLTQLQQSMAKSQNLQKTSEQLSEVYKKLQKEYEQRGKHVSKIKSLEQQLLSYRSMKKQHQKQLEKAIQQTKKREHEKQTLAKASQKQLNLAKQEKSTLQNKISDLSHQLENSRSQHQQAQNKSNKLASEVRQLNNKLKTLEGSAQKITKHSEKALQQKVKTVERRDEQIAALTKMKEENLHQIQKLTITLRSKTQQIQTMTNAIGQIQSKLSHAQKKYQELHKNSLQTHQSILELTLINKQQQIQLKSSKKQNQSLQISKLNLSKQIQKLKQRQMKSKQKISQLQSNQKLQVNKYASLLKELKQKQKQLIQQKLTHQKSIQKLRSQKDDIIIKKQLLEESYKKLQFMIKEEKIQTLSSNDQFMQTKTKVFIEELQARNMTYIEKMHNIQTKYQMQNRHIVQKYEIQLRQFYELKNQKHHLENMCAQLSKKAQNFNGQLKFYEIQEQILKNIIFYVRNTPKTTLQLDSLLGQLNQQVEKVNQHNTNKMYYSKQLIQQVYQLQKKFIESAQNTSEYLRVIKNNENQLNLLRQCLLIVSQSKKILNQNNYSSILNLPPSGAQISYNIPYQPFFVHSLQNLINVHRRSNHNKQLSQVVDLLHTVWSFIKQSSKLYSQSLKSFDSARRLILLQNKQKVQKLQYLLLDEKESHNNDVLSKLNDKQKFWQNKLFMETSQYEAKINLMKKQIHQLRTQTNSLHETIKHHSTTTDSSKYRIESDSNQILRLKQQISWLQLQKDSIENQYKKNQNIIHSQKRQITVLQQQKSLLQQKLSKQKESNMKSIYSERFLKQSIQELDSQLNKKNNQLSRLQLSKQSMQRDHSYQLQSTLQPLLRRIHQLQAINALNNLKVDNLQQNLSKIQAQKTNLQAKTQQIQYKNQKMQQKLAQEESNYQQVYSKFNILINEYDALSEQFQQLKIKQQNTVISLQAQITQLFAELQHTKQKKDVLHSQNKRLNGNIFILNNQIKEVMQIFRREQIDHYNHSAQCMLKDKTQIQILKMMYGEIDKLIKENQTYKLKLKGKNSSQILNSSSVYAGKAEDLFGELNQFIYKISQSLRQKLLIQNTSSNSEKIQILQKIIKKHKFDKISGSFNYQLNLLNYQRFIYVIQDSIIQLVNLSSNQYGQTLIHSDFVNSLNTNVQKTIKTYESGKRNQDKQNLKMMKHSPIQNILAMSSSQRQKLQTNQNQYVRDVIGLNFDKIIDSDENQDKSVIQNEGDSRYILPIMGQQDRRLVQEFEQLFDDVKYLVVEYQKSNYDNQYVQLLNKSLGIKAEDLQVSIIENN